MLLFSFLAVPVMLKTANHCVTLECITVKGLKTSLESREVCMHEWLRVLLCLRSHPSSPSVMVLRPAELEAGNPAAVTRSPPPHRHLNLLLSPQNTLFELVEFRILHSLAAHSAQSNTHAATED